jgi:hypothetical protein
MDYQFEPYLRGAIRRQGEKTEKDHRIEVIWSMVAVAVAFIYLIWM